MNTYPVFTRRSELILAAILFTLCMALAILTPGCVTVGKSGGPAVTIVQLAACTLVDRLPQSAGYLTASANVFHAFATAEALPSPAAVRAALAAIPNAKLTPAQQEIIWGATVLAYEVSQRAAQTPADFLALRGNLDLVASALLAAVKDCGPPTSSGLPAHRGADARPAQAGIDEQGLFDLAKTIGKQLAQ